MPNNIPLKEALTPLEYKIDSAGGVARKLDEKVNFASNISSLTKKQDAHFEAVGAAIGVYDNELANQYVDNDKVQKFIDLLHKNKEFTAQILPENTEKYNRLTANLEAYLKGMKFNLDGLGDRIVNQEEQKAFKEALNSTLLELSNHEISKEKYGEAILSKVKEKLSNNVPPASEELLKEAEKIITSSNKNKPQKNNDLTLDEKKIKETFENTLDKLSEFIEKNVETSKNIKQGIDIIQGSSIKENETLQKLLQVISKLPPEEIQEKGSRIVENFALLLENKDKKLVKATESLLKNMDAAFLAENSETIKLDLEKASKTSFLEKIRSFVTNWDKLKNATEHLEKENKYYIDKRDVKNKITASKYTENQVAKELSDFVIENKSEILKDNTLKNLVNVNGDVDITQEAVKKSI